uniref:Arf-GAP domain-containing protein n=1 Tax=Neolamprologus brichardi TaxID=32507 RepID=A0A3Q4GE85_NEOBR
MANRERNKKILLELVKQSDNSRCADCGEPEPDWASYKLGIFVCLNCSGIHRSLSSHVKSIRLDFWEDKLVEVITVLSVTHLYFCCIRLCLCVILMCVCVFILGDGSS